MVFLKEANIRDYMQPQKSSAENPAKYEEVWNLYGGQGSSTVAEKLVKTVIRTDLKVKI